MTINDVIPKTEHLLEILWDFPKDIQIVSIRTYIADRAKSYPEKADTEIHIFPIEAIDRLAVMYRVGVRTEQDGDWTEKAVWIGSHVKVFGLKKKAAPSAGNT